MKTYIAQLIDAALNGFELESKPDFIIEQPKIAEHGDLSTNVAMMLSKPLRKNPRQIAQELVEKLQYNPEYISKVEIAGQGFINFKLTNKWVQDQLAFILEKGAEFGKTDVHAGKKVLVEFVSANPTGPLTVGHGRNAVLGDTISRLYEWNGAEVTREYYFNNAGRQMRVLGESVFNRYLELLKIEDPLIENGYQGEYIEDIATNVALQLLLDKFNSYKKNKDQINTSISQFGNFFEQIFDDLNSETNTYYNSYNYEHPFYKFFLSELKSSTNEDKSREKHQDYSHLLTELISDSFKKYDNNPELSTIVKGVILYLKNKKSNPENKRKLRQKIASRVSKLDGLRRFALEGLYQYRFAKKAEQQIFNDIKMTLDRLNIQMDTFFNENTLYKDGSINSTIQRLRDKGLVYDADGAVWFKTTEFGKEKDTVLVKSSGEPTYRLPDIAYHVKKLERGFDICVDVFGADHIATYPDVVSGVEALGFDSGKIDVLIYQFVTIVKDGKPFKMSTRKANFVTLDELMDEVGEDVSRFFFLMRSPGTHLEFDIDAAKEASEKNPVFYLQYAHARIQSILRKASEEYSFSGNPDFAQLEQDAEIALVKELLNFPDTLSLACKTKEPQKVITYLETVAAQFTRFYHDCRVIGVNTQLAQARVELLKATAQVIRNGLGVLGITAPDSM